VRVRCQLFTEYRELLELWSGVCQQPDWLPTRLMNEAHTMLDDDLLLLLAHFAMSLSSRVCHLALKSYLLIN